MTGSPLTGFLLATSVIVPLCHALGAVAARCRQPRVIGEILGGLLLGPLALGVLWPGAEAALFPASVQASLDLAAQLGLVVFMFLLGCELRTSELRGNRAVLSGVVAGAIVLPFLGGVAVAGVGFPLIVGEAGDRTLTVLFIGLAVAVTALPVMARILVDLRMENSSAGVLALGAAACGDCLMWVALTVLLGASGQHGIAPGFTIALSVGLLAFTALVVRPVLGHFVRRADRTSRGEQLLIPVLVAGAIAYAVATQTMGLHLVIGAFLFGTAVPRQSPLVERVSKQMQGFTNVVLLPLFFAGIGLKISGAALGTSAAAWLLFGAMLFTAVVGKLLGGAGAGRLAGVPGRDAWRVGALMNCRGVTELVVAAIGWQYHLINTLGLTIITLVALITTAGTAPLLGLAERRFTRRPRRAPRIVRFIAGFHGMSDGQTESREPRRRSAVLMHTSGVRYMEIRMLGPLELVHDNQPVKLAGPRAQIALATLALDANHIVSVDRLVTALWNGDPPSTARGQVQICVSALRRAFNKLDQRGLIITRSPGYLLKASVEMIDALMFDRHLETAAQARTEGRIDEAAREIRAALELWRGPVLTGLDSEILLAAGQRFDDRRLTAIEDLCDIDLAGGRLTDIAKLRHLVDEHPLREHLHAQLMTALHRSGRQAEALEAYRNARAVLVDELGIEPGEELRRLEYSILTGQGEVDCSPIVVRDVEPVREPPAAVPRLLPADIADFTGREELVDEI